MASLLTKNSFEIRGKGHYAKRGKYNSTMEYTKSKIHREKPEENWTKQAGEEEKLNLDFLGPGSLIVEYSPFEHSMKILIFWRSEMCQKIPFVKCKSRSRTKARGKRQHSAGGLPDYVNFRS